MSVDGTVTGEYISEEAVAGSTVVLTIDSNVQKVAETALKNNMEKIKNGGFSEIYDVKSGAVVVMNVHSGEILALASYPDYEPQEFVGGISTAKWNEYNEPGKKTFLNRATQESYAPGSIFKMVSAIAALETGVTNTRETIYDTGVYPKAHKPKCWYYTDYGRGHGALNVMGAIKNSCNYFFYEMGIRMGIETLEKYARYFGLGSKTGVELLGETSGMLASKEYRDQKGEGEGYVLNAVIGQSDNSFSPIQMAKYISILSNGCHQVTPTLIKTIINPDGTEIPKEEIKKYTDEKLGITEEIPEDINVSEENLSAVLEGMRSVTTESGGTAYSIFRGFNIEVGGKTGSAEAGNNVNAWFAGFAPFDEPEIAVVVMVENGGHGSYTAEVVRDIMAEYFGMNAGSVYENMKAIPYVEQMN